MWTETRIAKTRSRNRTHHRPCRSSSPVAACGECDCGNGYEAPRAGVSSRGLLAANRRQNVMVAESGPWRGRCQAGIARAGSRMLDARNLPLARACERALAGALRVATHFGSRRGPSPFAPTWRLPSFHDLGDSCPDAAPPVMELARCPRCNAQAQAIWIEDATRASDAIPKTNIHRSRWRTPVLVRPAIARPASRQPMLQPTVNLRT